MLTSTCMAPHSFANVSILERIEVRIRQIILQDKRLPASILNALRGVFSPLAVGMIGDTDPRTFRPKSDGSGFTNSR